MLTIFISIVFFVMGWFCGINHARDIAQEYRDHCRDTGDDITTTWLTRVYRRLGGME